MIFRPRDPKRRPKHARPSVLAPTRTVVVLGGFGALTAAVVAGCATVTGGSAGAAQPPARPAAVRALPAADGGATVVQRFGAADFGAPPSGVLAAAPGPLTTGPTAAAQTPDLAPVSGLAASGIPSTALAAYRAAAATEATRSPSCGISWPLLAGIGRVESDHGRFAGAVLHSDGVSTPRIIGIPLDGHGTALIRDTDHGRLDGDTRYDRAVGPMQFIPSTWAGWGQDGNGDGVKDPFNIFDAASAAAHYLCAAGRDLRTTSGQVQAILSYNHSYDYVSMVMGLEKIYAAGVGIAVPVLPTPGPQHGRPAHKPTLPPVDPGHPGGLKPPAPPKHTPSSRPSSSSSSSSAPAPTSSSPTSPSPSPSESCGQATGASSSSSSASSSVASSSAPGSGDPSSTSPSCPSAPSGTGSSSGASSAGMGSAAAADAAAPASGPSS